jgi:hypothetical protein
VVINFGPCLFCGLDLTASLLEGAASSTLFADCFDVCGLCLGLLWPEFAEEDWSTELPATPCFDFS